MEIDVYEIGGKYGYKTWLSVKDNKVLLIDYEDPRSGGTLVRSIDGVQECDFSFLKELQPDLFNEIMRVKNGEVHNRYLVINDSGIYGDFEKWELKYEHNQRIFMTKSARIEISKYKQIKKLSF